MDSELATNTKLPDILPQLKALELGFHYPPQGKTKEDLATLMADGFWEVGASGRVYGKEFVLACLLKRSQNPCEVETRDFNCIEISTDNYLLTYTQIENNRTTRRCAIWRHKDGAWKNLYHQGTVVAD